MCGIVGYIGTKPVLPILLDGLKKLEYRGYDSAGVSFAVNDTLQTIKAAGKIAVLESKLQCFANAQSSLGIGHTRWATHGGPSETNAHPHMSADGKIAVVHNGIIENYASLKKKLQEKGFEFKSDTDTEVVTHLVSLYYNGDLKNAVVQAIRQLEGAFGFGIICANEPDVLIGARRGSPLVFGIGDNGDYYLASDVSAIVNYTQKVIYLDDNDIVIAHRGHYEIINLQNHAVQRKIKEIDFDSDAVAKGGFDHFMLKEIFEQPESLRNTMRGRIQLAQGNAKLAGLDACIKELRDINRIIITACGTSYYAGMVGEYLIEDLAGVPVEVEYASEFRYRNPIIKPDTLVLAISQSGETADTLAAMKEAHQKGATVLAICNVVGSSIARNSDSGVYLHAGPEIGVASTKAFSCQVVVLAMIALLLGRQRHVSLELGAEIALAITKLPKLVEETLKLNDSIKTIAAKYKDAKNFYILAAITITR